MEIKRQDWNFLCKDLYFLSFDFLGHTSCTQSLHLALHSGITRWSLGDYMGCQGWNPGQECIRQTRYLLYYLSDPFPKILKLVVTSTASLKFLKLFDVSGDTNGTQGLIPSTMLRDHSPCDSGNCMWYQRSRTD